MWKSCGTHTSWLIQVLKGVTLKSEFIGVNETNNFKFDREVTFKT